MDGIAWNQRLIVHTEGEVKIGFVYVLFNDETGEIIYVGSSCTTPKQRLAVHRSTIKQHIANGSHSSPLTRGCKEHDINPDSISMRVLRRIEYDSTRDEAGQCVRAEELAALAHFRRLKCPLLQRNAPVDTSAQRRYSAAFRTRNPEYMKEDGRMYRARQREQREQHNNQTC